MRYLFIFLFLVFFPLATTWAQAGDINKTDKAGKKQGVWKKKDAAGKMLYEGQFIDDKPSDTFTYYYPSGEVKAINHFSDKGRIARAQLFHLNGKKMAEGKYVVEKKDSVWKFYNEEGVLIAEENYVFDKKDGLC